MVRVGGNCEGRTRDQSARRVVEIARQHPLIDDVDCLDSPLVLHVPADFVEAVVQRLPGSNR